MIKLGAPLALHNTFKPKRDLAGPAIALWSALGEHRKLLCFLDSFSPSQLVLISPAGYFSLSWVEATEHPGKLWMRIPLLFFRFLASKCDLCRFSIRDHQRFQEEILNWLRDWSDSLEGGERDGESFRERVKSLILSMTNFNVFRLRLNTSTELLIVWGFFIDYNHLDGRILQSWWQFKRKISTWLWYHGTWHLK